MRNIDSYPVPLQPVFDSSWLQVWRESYLYDRLEVWKKPSEIVPSNVGYVCGYASRRKQTLESVLASCPPPARILDLAAAQGNFTISLASLGYQVTWNDLRAELADYVRLKTPPGVQIDFLAGNIFELGNVHIGSFDAVVALEVIEHVAHPDDFMIKLASLVKPGGVIILSTPNGGYLMNKLPRFSDCPDPSVFESQQFKPNSDGHIFLLYEDEIRAFAARAGLVVKQLDLITNPLTAGHIKLSYLLNLLPNWCIGAIESMTRRLPAALLNRISSHMVVVLGLPG